MNAVNQSSPRSFETLAMTDFIRDLSGLIAIPSVSEHKSEVRRALHYLLDLGERMGLETTAVLEDTVGVISIGQGEETVGMLVHVDVVPEGDSELWHYPPFELTQENGCFYGRGVADDKGPAAAALYAMAQLKPYEADMKKRVQLIIGTQEETAWTDMEAYCKAYALPDYGFTPDGEFPIANMEKGYADIELRFPRHRGRTRGLSGGDSRNTIPGFAALVFDAIEPNCLDRHCGCEAGEYTSKSPITIKAHAKSAHSSSPVAGENAIVKLCHLLFGKLSLFPEIEKLVVFVARELSGDLNGGRFGFQTEPQRYNGQDVHMTVMSPTLLQTTDSDFVLNINMRQTYGLTRACIEDAFNEKAACYGFSYKIIEYKDFLAVPSDRPFLQRMASSYEYETGRANAFITAHGTSYAKAMPYFVAWGPYFPEDCDSCHEADENIKIATLESAYRVYARALFNMVFDEENLK